MTIKEVLKSNEERITKQSQWSQKEKNLVYRDINHAQNNAGKKGRMQIARVKQ